MRLIASHHQDGAQDTELTISMHTGTHMDAPLHMIDGGKTIEDTPLSKLIAPCRVLDFSALADRITQADLAQKTINAGEFILLKTLNSKKDTFDFDFVFLDKGGAEYLKEKGAIGVGIDALVLSAAIEP